MGHAGDADVLQRALAPPCPRVSLRQSIASCRVRLRVRRRPLIRETREGASAFSDEIPAHFPQEAFSHAQPHIKAALARRRQAPQAVPPAGGRDQRARGGPRRADVAGAAHRGASPLRRAAHRRHGPERRLRRRDEDGRRKDARLHRGRLFERTCRRPGARGHRERLPGQTRRRMGRAHLSPARHGSRAHPERHGARRPQARLRRRRHLRHQFGVRVRLPARQHGLDAGRPRAARTCIRRGRRGRLRAHRRGAHAAYHLSALRCAFRGVRHLRRRSAGRWATPCSGSSARR